MQLIKHPERFCDDSKPYWILFLCFVFCCIMLLATLYTRQPERYRRISRWFTIESSSSSDTVEAQAAAFYNPGGGAMQRPVQAGGVMAPVPGQTRRIIEFGGMTLRDAAANQIERKVSDAARHGVEILRIDNAGIAYLSGLRTGDVIMSVNRLPTYTVDDFERVTRNLNTSSGILFDVYRNGRLYYMTVETRNTARW